MKLVVGLRINKLLVAGGCGVVHVYFSERSFDRHTWACACVRTQASICVHIHVPVLACECICSHLCVRMHTHAHV